MPCQAFSGKLIADLGLAGSMGEAGRRHAAANFHLS
jgi:hypothetical protein